jgi:hypothetical protein
MLADADRFAKHQACLMLQDAGILDARVGELAGTGESRRVAETVVSRFVQAGQVGRLRELATTHAEAAVREALGRLLLEAREPEAAR